MAAGEAFQGLRDVCSGLVGMVRRRIHQLVRPLRFVWGRTACHVGCDWPARKLLDQCEKLVSEIPLVRYRCIDTP